MTRTLKILLAALGVLVLVITLSASTQASVEPQTVRVTLTDFHVALSQFTVAPGHPVDFVVDNQGALPHRLVVRPYVDADLADAADAVTVAPGTQRSFSQTLEPGVYRVECIAWDHSERGMVNAIAANMPASHNLPIRMDMLVSLSLLVLGCAWIIGSSLGLRLWRS
jgi:plastocyanin